MKLFRRLCILFPITLLMTGCGSSDPQPRVAVHGEVFATGVLEIDGSVSLTPIEGGPACGAPVKRGQFEISKQRGPIPGTYRARLNVLKMKLDPEDSSDAAQTKLFRPTRLKIPEGGGKITIRFIANDD